MIHVGKAVLACLIVTGCAAKKDAVAEVPAPAAEATPRVDVFSRGAQALVRIETPHRFGGGFAVRADGVIVTTYSLIVHELAARAVLADGTMFAVERVLAVSPEHDLALVKIAAEGLASLELSADRTPTSGERILVVGQALGMAGPALVEGVVGQVPSAADSGVFEIASPLPFGFFGAPALDPSGRAVGIVGVQRPNGATVLAAMGIAELLARRGNGETMQAFGRRTRSDDGWEEAISPDPHALRNCSAASRERVWGELETALETAAPIFELGAPDAAFRILEGAVFYLARELPDCEELLDVLLTHAAQSRGRAQAAEAATSLAEVLHSTLELLFADDRKSASAARIESGWAATNGP